MHKTRRIRLKRRKMGGTNQTVNVIGTNTLTKFKVIENEDDYHLVQSTLEGSCVKLLEPTYGKTMKDKMNDMPSITLEKIVESIGELKFLYKVPEVTQLVPEVTQLVPAKSVTSVESVESVTTKPTPLKRGLLTRMFYTSPETKLKKLKKEADAKADDLIKDAENGLKYATERIEEMTKRIAQLSKETKSFYGDEKATAAIQQAKDRYKTDLINVRKEIDQFQRANPNYEDADEYMKVKPKLSVYSPITGLISNKDQPFEEKKAILAANATAIAIIFLEYAEEIKREYERIIPLATSVAVSVKQSDNLDNKEKLIKDAKRDYKNVQYLRFRFRIHRYLVTITKEEFYDYLNLSNYKQGYTNVREWMYSLKLISMYLICKSDELKTFTKGNLYKTLYHTLVNMSEIGDNLKKELVDIDRNRDTAVVMFGIRGYPIYYEEHVVFYEHRTLILPNVENMLQEYVY
jgi:hypothetical protein